MNATYSNDLTEPKRGSLLTSYLLWQSRPRPSPFPKKSGAWTVGIDGPGFAVK